MTTYLYGAHVRANGIRQHYLRYGGRGTPLIVIPGITSPAITWGFVGERLGRTYDTYVLDVRGRGLSEAGPDLAYDLDTYAADVAAFAAALNLPAHLVVGHSMGARIGARLGHKHGKPIKRLILVDPPVSGPGRRAYGRSLPFYIDAIRAAKAGITPEAIRKTYPTWTDEQIRLRAEWLHTCDERAIAETHRGFQDEEIHSDLPRLVPPSLLVVAGKGGVILDEDIAEMRALAPKLEIRTVPTAGHMIPFDDFEGFFRAIDDFLAR